MLNAVEALTDQTIGGVINNVKVGDTVTINLGSLSYQTTIQAGGVWSYIIPPTDLSKLLDGNTVLSVSVTDHVGNVVTNNVNVGIHIHNLPTVSLDPIFGDGILNVLDLLTGQVISGTVQMQQWAIKFLLPSVQLAPLLMLVPEGNGARPFYLLICKS
ncbi:Ig-like domain-containing protein [Budvicia aquatica]|uniref:hypothetical protein n=1 Tax=Budvicia aquatica TaxID=82979 RepID=UPI00106C1F65|nr:hypothetical protein [Budvicia aquatica]